MKLLHKQPKTGQFVGIHEYGGEIWSTTYKWIDGVLCVFCDDIYDFMEEVGPINTGLKHKYITNN